MGFLELLGLNKKKTSARELRTMLPALHSFVDCAVKGGPKGSVCFENTGTKTFTTSTLQGMTAGQTAMFLYSNASGKYRFSAPITAVDAKQATYTLPGRIETVQKYTGTRQRSNVRIDTTVTSQWRFAPTGKIETAWQKGVLSDISRGGASLTADRSVNVGQALELKVPLLPNGGSVVVGAEARRVDQLEKSKKFTVGLRFLLVSPQADKAILEFINRRQLDLRSRGLG